VHFFLEFFCGAITRGASQQQKEGTDMLDIYRNLDEIFAGTQHAGHRRPREAGGADAWYGRACEPNFTINGVTLIEQEMTAAEVAEYRTGYASERGRKCWGVERDLREDDDQGDDVEISDTEEA
jgi:hypothetical protein